MRSTFFKTTTFLWTVALLFITVRTLADSDIRDVTPTVYTIAQAAEQVLEDFSKIALGIVVIAMLATPPISFVGDVLMGIYHLIVNRWVKPAIEEHEARGEAIGEARGEARGRAAMHSEWEAWNQRRLDAEVRGEPFDEPPPDKK